MPHITHRVLSLGLIYSRTGKRGPSTGRQHNDTAFHPKSGLIRFIQFNVNAINALAPCVIRPSAAMLLTLQKRPLSSTRGNFNYLHYLRIEKLQTIVCLFAEIFKTKKLLIR